MNGIRTVKAILKLTKQVSCVWDLGLPETTVRWEFILDPMQLHKRSIISFSRSQINHLLDHQLVEMAELLVRYANTKQT